MSKAFTEESEEEADFEDEIPLLSARTKILHHAGGPSTAPGRVCPIAKNRASQNRRDGVLGRGQWRPVGKWRLYLRQAAPAGDRQTNAVSPQRDGNRRSRRSRAAKHRERVYFGATVVYRNARDEEKTVRIVGIDEARWELNEVS